MGNGIAIIRSSEQRSIEGDYPQDSDYRENNDFFYLTGLETPSSWLVLVARDTLAPQVYLYLPARDTMAERWTGARLGPGPEASALTGIEETRPADQAQKQIRGMVRSSTVRGGKLYLLLGKEAVSDTFFQQLALGSGAGVTDLRPSLAAMRLVKDADEMRRLRMAARSAPRGTSPRCAPPIRGRGNTNWRGPPRAPSGASGRSGSAIPASWAPASTRRRCTTTRAGASCRRASSW